MYYMLLSSLLLALFSLFGKFATSNTPLFLLTFLRFLVPLVIMLPYLLWTSSFSELFKTQSVKLQILRSLCMLVYQYSVFYYLMHSSLLNVTVLQNTYPLFLPILEKIFFKHHFNKREIFSIFICFAGVLCILQPDQGIFESLSIVVLITPLSQAGSQILFAHQSGRENPKSTLFYLYFFTTLGTAIVYLLSSESFAESGFAKQNTLFNWANIVALGVVSIFNQYFRGKAYQHGRATSFAPFLYVSLIFAAFFDWAIFNELPNGLSYIGASLVILGGMIQLYRR